MLDNFLGLIPPRDFLETFMNIGDVGSSPTADFSSVIHGADGKDMGGLLIKSIEKCGLCPSLRFCLMRTKRHRSLQNRENAGCDVQGSSGIHQSRLDEEVRNAKEAQVFDDLVPVLGAKRRPKPRRGARKRRDVLEYCDFATYLLGVDIHPEQQTDPFLTAEELTAPSSTRSSPFSDNEGPHERSHQASPSSQGGGPCTPVTPIGVHTPQHADTPSNPGPSTPTPSPLAVKVNGIPLRHYPSVTPSPLNSPSDGQPVETRSDITVQRELLNEEYAPSSHSSQQAYMPPIERGTEQATRFRSSIISHVRALFYRQHRRFLFHLVLFHRSARFIRFDRAGAVVSEHFDYVQQPDLLASFLWRFARMTDVQRGFDSTVSLPTRQEKQLFADAVQTWLREMEEGGLRVRKLPGAEYTLDDSGTFPTWKVHVVNETTGKSSDLLIRRPFAGELALWGRSTRAYIAYDLVEKRLVFFKDSWRGDCSYLRPEFQTFEELRVHGVPHVPATLYGGDVHDASGAVQETAAHEYAATRPAWMIGACILYRHVHHRIVQDIAYPLASARSPREFVQIIRDAVHAIHGAHEKLRLLHRDISYGNIMITPDGRGILNDWDHAGPKDVNALGIGTWKFMSTRLLECPNKVHDIVDDLESVIWVTLYGAIELFALPDQQVVAELFSHREIMPDGRAIGGLYKRLCIAGAGPFKVKLSDPGLQQLIEQALSSWYMYDMARKGAPDIKLPETRVEIMKHLDTVSKSSFWVDTFDEALRWYGLVDGSPPRLTPDGGSCQVGSPSLPASTLPVPQVKASLGRKRQLQTQDAEESYGLRRSKRLRNLRSPPAAVHRQ